MLARIRSRDAPRQILLYPAAALAVARLRRKLGLPRPLTLALVAGAPAAVAAGAPKSRWGAAATWAAQMWAYKVAFEIPYDNPAKLRRRLRVDYPIRCDSLLGGEPPSARLQRALRSPPRLTALDRALAVLYFSWEPMPHLSLTWILLRHPQRFARAALVLGATFDLTLVGYYAVPTAPPWWASEEEGRMGSSVRRVAVEVMHDLRGKPRPAGDHERGANPWASMPSDHFGSTVATAMLLYEASPVAGAAAWSYALALGFALVYLGEHYVVDLAAGLALAAAVNRAAPRS